MDMRFSVVIPLYNKERYIERAIRSVLNQTYRDYEIIIVNDGSTDRGPELIKKIHDPRIRRVHQPNLGVSAARNRGIDEAQSEYIAFLDADDEWISHFLLTIQKLIARYSSAGAYATAYQISFINGKTCTARCSDLACEDWEGLLPDYFRCATFDKPPIHTSSVCIPKRVLAKIGKFAVGETLGEDLDMWGRIALHYPIAYSGKVSTIYHWATVNSLNVNRKWEKEWVFEQNVKEYLSENFNKNPYVLEYVYRFNLDIAASCLRAGNYTMAKRLIKENRTTHFRLKKYLLRICLILPSRIIVAFHSLRRRFQNYII